MSETDDPVPQADRRRPSHDHPAVTEARRDDLARDLFRLRYPGPAWQQHDPLADGHESLEGQYWCRQADRVLATLTDLLTPPPPVPDWRPPSPKRHR